MNYNSVYSIIEKDKDFLINLTKNLVQTPSVNPKLEKNKSLNKEKEVQNIIEKTLVEEGFEIDRWDVFENRPNVVGKKNGNEDRSLILNGHIDVVPTGELSNWSVDPFGGEIKDGKIFGRGSVDMKSGVALMIYAARAIRMAGIELDGSLSVHSVVDEETGGSGSKDVVKKGYLAKSIITTEPTWGNILPAEGALEWVRVTIPGRSAHAGFRFNELWPQHHTKGRLIPGVNAIEIAVRFLNSLRNFEKQRCSNKYHPLCPPGLSTINPGVIRGGVGEGEDGLPIIMSNPAMVSDIVTIDLDYKFLPNEKQSDVRKEFEEFVYHFCQTDSWLKENPIKIKWELGGLYFPPMDTPIEHPLIQSLINHNKNIGKNPKIKAFEAVADVCHYADAGVEGAVMFGASGDGFHGVDEYVEIDSMINAAKVVAGAILDICGQK